jgi:hypothetical protein
MTLINHKNGPYKTEITYPKGQVFPKIKPEKGKAYAKQPVVIVFKTSNRSNAKLKSKYIIMKILTIYYQPPN